MFNKKTAMSLFIAVIMILSVIGFVLVDYDDGSNSKETYNGYKFVRLPNGWRGTIDGEKIVFNYLPTQVEDLKITPEVKTILQNTPIIAVTYDPESRWAQDYGALQYYLEQSLKSNTRFIQRALVNNTKYPQIQQITCKNASQKLPVILLNINTTQNSTQIKYENNCITANAMRWDDLYRATDRLIYLTLGVMKE